MRQKASAFFSFEEQMVFPQAFQDLRNMVAMFGHAPGEDKGDINVEDVTQSVKECRYYRKTLCMKSTNPYGITRYS